MTQQPAEAQISKPQGGRNTSNTVVPDTSILVPLLGKDTTDELVSLHQKISLIPGAKSKNLGYVIIPTISDREKRSKIHMVTFTTPHLLLCHITNIFVGDP